MTGGPSALRCRTAIWPGARSPPSAFGACVALLRGCAVPRPRGRDAWARALRWESASNVDREGTRTCGCGVCAHPQLARIKMRCCSKRPSGIKSHAMRRCGYMNRFKPIVEPVGRSVRAC
eukprot:365380-Chlamydomonas_euryale.AAC.5